MKSTLILAALAGLLGVPVAHAQSSATFIGLSKAYLRYVADPNGEQGWFSYDVPHCRQFGMGNIEDLGPRFLLHFVFETDPMSSTDRRVGAMTTMHAQQGSSGLIRRCFSSSRYRGARQAYATCDG